MANANSPLFISPTLSAVAIKYRQKGMVADLVMPRTTVDKQEFIFLQDRIGEWLTPPDTSVGRTGAPNALANSAQDPIYLATANQGLDEPVPNQDEKNGPTESALARATQRVMSFVELRREQRVAAACSTAGNFAYSAALSGASQWSDYTNSTPFKDLMDNLDKPFMRPNTLMLGRTAWTGLQQNPRLVEAVLGRASTSGVITREQLAAKLEIEQIIVGDGWINTAAKGQAVNKQRIWGKFCAGIYLGQDGGPDSGNTWGFTAQFGARIAGTIPDSDIGLFGGVKVRAGESVKEVVAAPEFGFLLTNVVS